MGIYTTFFLGEPESLLREFPEWRLPLPHPVRREVRNPFTGELLVIESREPEWPDDTKEAPDLEYQAIVIKGSYESYLEERLPLFVRHSPHWATKGLTIVELHPLLDVLEIAERIEHAIYSPPSSGNCVEQFPDEFLAKLKSADLRLVAEQWAAILSTPQFTHSVSGLKLYDGWTESDARKILDAVISLGQNATQAQKLYLLTEV